MKTTQTILVLALFSFALHANPRHGFYLPDSITEFSFKYRSVENLIILPVTINDTIQLNLILDTGCRSLVLFGKKFDDAFIFLPEKRIQFSGLGEGKPISGKISLHNKVTLGEVLGEDITLVVVGEQNVFRRFPQIHGVIGYDLFTRFEIELIPRRQMITLRSVHRRVGGRI